MSSRCIIADCVQEPRSLSLCAHHGNHAYQCDGCREWYDEDDNPPDGRYTGERSWCPVMGYENEKDGSYCKLCREP